MAKLLSSLPNYEFDVVTFAGWKKWFGEDRSFESVIDEKFGNIEYLLVPRILQWIPLGRFGPLGKLPDAFRFFNFLLFKKAKKMIIENRYEVMITWSQPHSSHLVGLKLKASVELSPKWLAHFSDPWPSNPYFKSSKLIKRVNRNLFTRVLNQADAVSVTNDYAIMGEDGFSSVENRSKVHVVPHSYMPNMYPCEDKNHAHNQIIIRYLGSFYGLRRPDPILLALTRLEVNEPSIAKKLRVEFIGSKLDEKSQKDLQKLKFVSIDVLPSVSFRESLGLMQNADLLLIIDAPLDVSPFLPSKLIDYVGSNVPILAFTPPGPSEDVVRELGGWVASPTDMEQCYNSLKDALEMVISENFDYAPPIRVVDNFKSSKNGKLLVDIIEQNSRRVH